MSVNYGSRRLVVGSHHGLRDWMAQRTTAVIMALYALVLFACVLFADGEDAYTMWAGIFAPQWMKTLTFIAILAMLLHAWIGMKEVFMDYVKPVVLRLCLNVFAAAWMVGCAGWAIQALWRS